MPIIKSVQCHSIPDQRGNLVNADSKKTPLVNKLLDRLRKTIKRYAMNECAEIMSGSFDS